MNFNTQLFNPQQDLLSSENNGSPSIGRLQSTSMPEKEWFAEGVLQAAETLARTHK